MVRGLVSSTLLVSLLLLATNLTITSGATDSNIENPEIIDFEDSDGTHFVDTLYLNGSMNFDGFNHSWEIVDLFDLDVNDNPKSILSGQYLDTIIPIESGLWKWNLIANISDISCTCNLIISSTSNSQNGVDIIYSSSLLVYLGEVNINHHPYILYNSVSNEKIGQSNYSVTFTVITPHDSLEDSISLSNQHFILYSNYCQAPLDVCLNNPSPVVLNYTYNSDMITVFIDQDELLIDDGFWQFDFSLKDQFLRESNSVSSTLVLDINPPNVTLTINSEIRESEPFLVYAYVDDYFIGSQLSLTWTITDPNGNSRGLLDEEAYHNSTIELQLDKSGYWDIQIMVRDSANFIVIENITIRVENMIPIIDLDLDGLSVSQGDELFVTDGSPWLLNASESFDSPNDIDSLKFEWYVNGVMLEVYGNSVSNKDIELKGTSEISVVVIDDDFASDNLSFSLSVNQVSEDESSSTIILMFSSGFFIIALIVGFILYSRRDSSSIEVPKWNSKN